MHGCTIACVLLVSLAFLCAFVVQMEKYYNLPCEGVDDPVLSICLLCTSETATRRAFAELNWAFYPQRMAVELILIGGDTVAFPLWRHLPYKRVPAPPARFHDRARCIVVLNDTAEVSPVFGFWFYYTCGRASGDFVVSGGESGLAFSGPAWERWVRDNRSFIAVNTIHPPEGYTFVRGVRQNQLEPEREPKLVRTMNLWSL